ncbi:MAG: hypothetical protein KC646_09420 [Candidatus Cloacimonetes bacterium]|nr:hypothetical protein [Candidatus Cloacimonadota bacterium]
MQPKSLKTLQDLACGNFTLSLSDIVNYSGQASLPVAIDIYQSFDDPKKSPQILIKTGVDLKKKQKHLNKFFENSLKTDSELPYLANKEGDKLTDISISVTTDSLPYFQESAAKNLDKVLRFIDSSPITTSIDLGQLSLLSKIKVIFTELMKGKLPTFLLFSVDESDLADIFHNTHVAFYCIYIAQIHSPGADWIPTLFQAALFHELGDKPPKDCEGEKATRRGASLTDSVLENLKALSIPSSSLALIKSHHKLLVEKDKKGKTAAKILQTINAIDAISRGGFICIGTKIEICSGANIDKACETLVVKSNPQVNDTCPAPIYDESIVNIVLTLLGRGYLIEKERQIRNEILSPCEYTNCQSNRITVSCHNDYFKGSYQKKHQFCLGQGGDINLVSESGKSTYIPKCNNGCDIMNKINLQYKVENSGED